MNPYAKVVMKAGCPVIWRIFFIASVMFTTGCNVTEFFNKDKPGSTNIDSTSSSKPDTDSQQLPFFVGVDGLALYTNPTVTSSVITRLRLHQKVVRSKLEKGYAYISVPDSGREGWVDNAKLIWKLPLKSAPIKKNPQPITDPAVNGTDEKPAAPSEGSTNNSTSEDSIPINAPVQKPEAKPTELEPGTLSPAIFNSF